MLIRISNGLNKIVAVRSALNLSSFLTTLNSTVNEPDKCVTWPNYEVIIGYWVNERGCLSGVII